MKTNKFTKYEVLNKENSQSLGDWYASRLTVIRSAYIGNAYITLEKYESFNDKCHQIYSFYAITVNGEYWLDHSVCYTYDDSKKAWADWEFMVGSGEESCPTDFPVTHTIHNFITGEIIQYPVFPSEDELDVLEEKLYVMWGYQPSAINWHRMMRKDDAMVVDLEYEDYYWVFRESDTEFVIRKYGF